MAWIGRTNNAKVNHILTDGKAKITVIAQPIAQPIARLLHESHHAQAGNFSILIGNSTHESDQAHKPGHMCKRQFLRSRQDDDLARFRPLIGATFRSTGGTSIFSIAFL